jgi:hypothetical protein
MNAEEEAAQRPHFGEPEHHRILTRAVMFIQFGRLPSAAGSREYI